MEKLHEANHPYFIQNKDKTVNTPINTIDCIRIYNLLKELKVNPEAYPWLWSPLHVAKFNLNSMTIIMDNESPEILILVRGEKYERPRGEIS